MALPKRFRPYAKQARAQGQLQYGAQQNLLAMLLGEAGNDLQRSVNQAQGGAKILRKGIDEARSGLDRNLAAAGLNPQTLEGTPDQRRIQQTVANSLNELDLRKVQADEYGASGVRQARDVYSEGASKIKSQLIQLLGDRGVYESGLLDQLIEGDRGARRTARAEMRQQSFDAGEGALERANDLETALIGQGIGPGGTIIPGSKADPKAPGNKTPKFKWSEAEQRKASDTIEKALSYVKKADPGKGDMKSRRSAIAKTLVEGLPGQTDPLTGKTQGGVPSLPALYVSAALDLHFGKALGRKTVQRLHDRGVKIKPLGYPTATKPRSHTIKRPGNAPSAGGQQRPT